MHDDSASLQGAIDAAAIAGVPVFVPRGAFRTTKTLNIPQGVQLVGLARHLTSIVSDDASFANTGNALRSANAANPEPNYQKDPPILSFGGKRTAGHASDTNAATGGGLETVFFGMTLVIPVWNNLTTTSAWHYTAGTESPTGFGVARQVRPSQTYSTHPADSSRFDLVAVLVDAHPDVRPMVERLLR